MQEPGATQPIHEADARSMIPPVANIANGGTESDAINIQLARSGAFLLSSEFNTDTITFKGAQTKGGTYNLIDDKGGTVVSIAGETNKWTEFHEAVMAFPWIKIVTDTATGAAATIPLVFKT